MEIGDKIAQAKRDFQMRIKGSNQGQPSSGRVHVGEELTPPSSAKSSKSPDPDELES